MRYFLDTEYDGWGGKLISLALVPEQGSEELYIILHHEDASDPWVERNVLPFLDHVPDHLHSHRLTRIEGAAELVRFFQLDDHAIIAADWPEDIAQFAMLLVTGPGRMAAVPSIAFELLVLPGFSTAANSAVPHNALHDARALRDHLLAMDG